MDNVNIITLEPGKRSGNPCIRGMRITVYNVLSYLAAGMTSDEILRDHLRSFFTSPRTPSLRSGDTVRG
ncbi:MAG: DUF433 domain-containing protein [Chloroflexota bacterium]|nr:DUF433 domain-containing protein [Chloroflexota bacterium]